MDKKALRATIADDVASFLASGGTILTGKNTIKRKPAMTASGSQKPYFSWSAPKNRPSNAWDGISFNEK